eukprot:COSAG03_NODE_3078_length_2242_cov_4.406237_1_plen_72_part_00
MRVRGREPARRAASGARHNFFSTPAPELRSARDDRRSKNCSEGYRVYEYMYARTRACAAYASSPDTLLARE